LHIEYAVDAEWAPSTPLPVTLRGPGALGQTHRSEDRSVEAISRRIETVRLRLIPREERFYDMFVEDAANMLGTARLLEEMLRSYDDVERRAAELRDAEHRGDEISHEIGHKLEATFVTPFDREDIYALISALDDVVDMIEEIGDTFVLYRIDAPTPAAIELASIIVRQCELLHEALLHLRGFRGLDTYWIEVHRLENEGDRVSRAAIADLFDQTTDAMAVIKWRKDYNSLEETGDACEDVANIIERISIKNA
jgi:predicted phosphate transport protein (TIGR00153 family)